MSVIRAEQLSKSYGRRRVASLGTYRVGSLIYHAITYNPLREGLSIGHAGVLLSPRSAPRAPPARAWPREPKDRHIEDKKVRLSNGTTMTIRVHAVDGALGIAVPV